MKEIRLKLGFKLRLTDLLIKPIQRLTKYHMLLEAILKYSERTGLVEEAAAIQRAFHVMTVVPNQANDMMDIGRLQGFEVRGQMDGRCCASPIPVSKSRPDLCGDGTINGLWVSLQGKITAQGKLLHRGPLNALDTFSSPPQNGPPKMKPFTCFLFEQIMIFSEMVGKKTQFTSPVYVYKAHFLVRSNAVCLRWKGFNNDQTVFPSPLRSTRWRWTRCRTTGIPSSSSSSPTTPPGTS